MSIPDYFRLRNCNYLFSKHTEQHILPLLTLFKVPIDEVSRKFGEKCIKSSKMENFEIFVIFGVNLIHFHSEHYNYPFIKDYWTTHSFLDDHFQRSNPQSPSKIQKMQKNFEKRKILGFSSFSFVN